MVAIDDLMSRDEGKDLVGVQNLCLPTDDKVWPNLAPRLVHELVGVFCEFEGVHVCVL